MQETYECLFHPTRKINKFCTFHLNQEGMQKSIIPREILPFKVFGINSDRLDIVTPILDK